jgi:NAD(P)H-flavin reductase/hemoglobin-like flavoprotein
VGLADRDALQALHDAVGRADRDELMGRFYTCWFALDPSVRDLFPPAMTAQREMFAQALQWVLGELIAQHSEEPVAFLAQLGRDHRKYGVTAGHYEVMAHALYATLCADQADRWTESLDDAAQRVINFMVGVMSGAAEAEPGPAWWTGTVAECRRASRDVTVVRLYLDKPMDYLPGQYVSVEVPQCPRNWRYLSPAIPAQPDGGIEFHIRAVPGGLVSGAIVEEARPGDRWRISSPHGALQVDRTGEDVLMVAGSTGLAPLRAIIMDLCRFGSNPRVHLFYGARFPYELYDLRTLWQLASTSPWLSVTPVSEFSTDPPWAADYPDVQPPRGLHVRQKGRLPEVVTGYGSWADRQILISGSPGMVSATRAALLASGQPRTPIQHDPIVG